MPSKLETTGTNALLQQLSGFIPDQFINELVPAHRGRGRRPHWSSAQLYRLLLLVLLTPARSYNLMLRLLEEQREWRKFARLPNRYRLPVASQLHDFRQAIGVRGLRRINEFLLEPLLESLMPDRKAIALIDATDLPASTSSFKKNYRPLFGPQSSTRWQDDQDWSEPMVCWLQKAQPSFVASSATGPNIVNPHCVLGSARQSRGGAVFVAEPVLLLAAAAMASGHCRGRHGLHQFGRSA